MFCSVLYGENKKKDGLVARADAGTFMVLVLLSFIIGSFPVALVFNGFELQPSCSRP